MDINDIVFDDKGLIPAIVQDHNTNEVLMMAYMNRASIEKTLATKQTHFYSRSRNELWHKGETSGNFQDVVSMEADCDSDTLLIRVIPHGPACHTGKDTCFFNPILEADSDQRYDPAVLTQLEKVVKNRKANPVEGSYTNYLFKEGVDKICKKIGEEAAETIIAAKNNSQEELIYEASDFLYHLTVLLANQGVSWQDLYKELEKRHK